VKFRHGPATVSGEETSDVSHWCNALGRQLVSDEPQVRRPTEFTSFESPSEGVSMKRSEFII